MTVFRFAEGFAAKIDAQIAGERLEKLRGQNGGRLTPAIVISDARSKRSPLHEQFDWNDEVAGERWRLHQARQLMNHLVVEFKSPASPVPRVTRYYVNVKRENEREYVERSVALSQEVLREQLLQRAIDELVQWRERWAEFTELTPVFAAIDHLNNPSVRAAAE